MEADSKVLSLDSCLASTLTSDSKKISDGVKMGAVGYASVGSILHGTGCCRPCAWFWKPHGCSNGQDCRHCHACPEGEAKLRKKAKVLEMHRSQSNAVGIDTVDAVVPAVFPESAGRQMASSGGGKPKLAAPAVVTTAPGLSVPVPKLCGTPCHSGVDCDVDAE